MGMNHNDWLKLAGALGIGLLAGKGAGLFGGSGSSPAAGPGAEAAANDYSKKMLLQGIGQLAGSGREQEEPQAPAPEYQFQQMPLLPQPQVGNPLTQGLLGSMQQYGRQNRFF